MITRIFDKDGIRYAVGEQGVVSIDDFSAAVGYPNFVVYLATGKRYSIYNPNMTVEYDAPVEIQELLNIESVLHEL